ncbi:hypothetical protein HP062_25640 [Pseudomonas sp. B14-6]|uniref:hypothetical protein n=1 Tax=Pseudomonas sp. B14-6 TaxID=2738843 RepID=UPI00155E39A1|nr:hypothetical protein [Pseudomonas sp. B14-6]QKG68707.1 hypothetical protein HP062_25640 [Pseudomonas sp. B14-6]
MSVKSTGDKFSGASKTGTVSENKEDWEREPLQSFLLQLPVQFSNNLIVTVEDQPDDKTSGIVKAPDGAGFGDKSLYLPSGSRLKLSFGNYVNSLRFQIKAAGGNESGTAYIIAMKKEEVVYGAPISSEDKAFEIAEIPFDVLLIAGFSGKLSVTAGNLYLDNLAWSLV